MDMSLPCLSTGGLNKVLSVLVLCRPIQHSWFVNLQDLNKFSNSILISWKSKKLPFKKKISPKPSRKGNAKQRQKMEPWNGLICFTRHFMYLALHIAFQIYLSSNNHEPSILTIKTWCPEKENLKENVHLTKTTFNHTVQDKNSSVRH